MITDQQPDDEPLATVQINPKCVRDTILYPVTISQLLQSASSGTSLANEGKDHKVTLVAHVTRVDINSPRASFTLEDGTGRIFAEKVFVSIQCGFEEAEEEEATQLRAFEHTFVEVIGTLRDPSDSLWKPRIQIQSIHLVHGYHQVMYHILNVINCHLTFQQYPQPYDPDQDYVPNEDVECRPLDDGQAQDEIQTQHIHAVSALHPVLPNTFSPQKHQPYAALKPLERTIMKYMHHHRDHAILIEELALVIQESSGCTGYQFNFALQTLLSEAYLTSPLDDGYVVVTPRQMKD